MKVYFAHPCFTEEQRQFKREFLGRLRDLIAASGGGGRVAVIDPFDHAPNIEHNLEEKLRMSGEIKPSVPRAPAKLPGHHGPCRLG